MAIDPRILQLLQQVGQMPAAGPGITPIAPTLAPAGPTPSAPAQPGQAPQNPNFMQRVGNFMVPGAQGLLTPEEQQQLGQQSLLSMGLGLLEASGPSPTPVSLGQALNRAYQGAAPQMGQLASGLLQTRKAQDLERKRAAIFKRHPEQPNETPTQTGERYLRMLNDFMEIEDTETVARLSELLKSMPLGREAADRMMAVPSGSRLYDPKTGQVVLEPDPRAAGGAGGAGGTRWQRTTLRNPKTGQPEVALFDPVTGQFKFTGMSPGTTRGLSETASKMAAHLEMVAPAVDILDAAAGPPDRWSAFARQHGLNEALSANQQVIDVASRQVADAFLRMTTGAAYNAEELANALIINTPRPGDSERVKAYKVEVRKRMITALRILATGGYGSVQQVVDDTIEDIDSIPKPEDYDENPPPLVGGR